MRRRQQEKREMKRTLMGLTALLVCGAAMAAQDVVISEREVRDPRQLKAWLEANATDAEARLGAAGAVADSLALVNLADGGTAKVTLQADKADDAGDKFGIVASDGGGLLIQSDATSKGTLATKATFSTIGGLTLADGLTITDASGDAVITATAKTGNYSSSIVLDADAGEDNEDTWTIRSTYSDNDLDFLNHTTVRMSLTAAGALTVDDLITTDDVTVGDDLIVAGLATVGETLTVTGALIGSTADFDSVTVNAGQGVDCQSAGALKVGVATATSVDYGSATATAHTFNSDGGTVVLDGTIAATDAITLTDADGHAIVTVKAASGAYNADLILEADASEDNEDTWTIRSAAGDNDLDFLNHTSTRMTLSKDGNLLVAGTAKSTGDFTVGSDKVVITASSGNILSKGTIGAGANGTEFTVSSAGNTAVGGTLGVTGNTTLGAAGKFITTPVANANVTNEQVLTLAGVVNLFTGVGGEDATTNTVTLANPTAAGQWAIIYNAAAATNLLAIAKTGNFEGPALLLSAGESAILFAPSSTKWAGIGQ